MKKKWPELKSDEDAERFVTEADLTEFDFSEIVSLDWSKAERVRMPNLKPSSKSGDS